ncbi:unnamed protein product, partial [Mesorhabditis spiculigera]
MTLNNFINSTTSYKKTEYLPELICRGLSSHHLRTRKGERCLVPYHNKRIPQYEYPRSSLRSERCFCHTKKRCALALRGIMQGVDVILLADVVNVRHVLTEPPDFEEWVLVWQIIRRRPLETDRNRHGFQPDRDRDVFNVLSCQDSHHSPSGRHRIRSSSRAAGNPCLPSPAIANGRPPSNPCFNSEMNLTLLLTGLAVTNRSFATDGDYGHSQCYNSMAFNSWKLSSKAGIVDCPNTDNGYCYKFAAPNFARWTCPSDDLWTDEHGCKSEGSYDSTMKKKPNEALEFVNLPRAIHQRLLDFVGMDDPKTRFRYARTSLNEEWQIWSRQFRCQLRVNG